MKWLWNSSSYARTPKPARNYSIRKISLPFGSNYQCVSSMNRSFNWPKDSALQPSSWCNWTKSKKRGNFLSLKCKFSVRKISLRMPYSTTWISMKLRLSLNWSISLRNSSRQYRIWQTSCACRAQTNCRKRLPVYSSSRLSTPNSSAR